MSEISEQLDKPMSEGMAALRGEKKESNPPKSIELKVQTISWDKHVVDMRGKGIEVTYKSDTGEFLDLHAEGHWVRIPAEEIIKVATDMQRVKRQDGEDVENIDFNKLCADFLATEDEDDGTIQVLEGRVDNVIVEDFAPTPKSLHELVHFIKVNNLQDQKPWSVIWGMYQCLLVASGRA